MDVARRSRGDWRVWAEPETGGEAYIPRNVPAAQALPILREAASWHGADVVTFQLGGLAGLIRQPSYDYADFGSVLGPAARDTNWRQYDIAVGLAAGADREVRDALALLAGLTSVGSFGFSRGGVVAPTTFDQGGYLPPKSMGIWENNTPYFERVLSPAQTLAAGGGAVVRPTVSIRMEFRTGDVGDLTSFKEMAQEVAMDTVRYAFRELRREQLAANLG